MHPPRRKQVIGLEDGSGERGPPPEVAPEAEEHLLGRRPLVLLLLPGEPVRPDADAARPAAVVRLAALRGGAPLALAALPLALGQRAQHPAAEAQAALCREGGGGGVDSRRRPFAETRVPGHPAKVN